MKVSSKFFKLRKPLMVDADVYVETASTTSITLSIYAETGPASSQQSRVNLELSRAEAQRIIDILQLQLGRVRR